MKLIQANLHIAYDILSPRIRVNPGFVWISLQVNTNAGILLLSNLLSMTPGTLSIEVSPDKRKLLVHCLYIKNEADIVADIEGMQKRIIELTQ